MSKPLACQGAHQKFSLLATVHDCETGLIVKHYFCESLTFTKSNVAEQSMKGKVEQDGFNERLMLASNLTGSIRSLLTTAEELRSITPLVSNKMGNCC